MGEAFPLVRKLELEPAIEHGEGQLDWAVMARQQFRNSGLEEA